MSKPIRKSPFLLQAFSNRNMYFVGILFVAVFLLYANTLPHGYVMDDAVVILENEFTKQGVKGWKDLFTKDTFHGFFGEEKSLVSGGRYRPLTLAMFALEWQVAPNAPWLGHLINILLYGGCCCMIYLTLLLMFGGKKASPKVRFMAFVISLLYLIHPVHTEVVANIKGRDEILAMVGGIGALYFGLKAWHVPEKKYRWLICSGLLGLLGLFSKENAITFCAVIPLTIFVFTQATFKQVLAYSLPFWAAAFIFLLVRSSIVGTSLGAPGDELMNNPFLTWVDGEWVAFSMADQLATVFYTWLSYFRILIFPHPLSHDYYPLYITAKTFSDPAVWGSVLLQATCILYALIRLPKRDPIAYGILFFYLTFSIVSNLVFPVGTNLSERFMFMPSLGYCLILGILVDRLSQVVSSAGISKKIQWAIPALLIGTVGIFHITKTITRNPVWKDNATLLLTDIKHAPRSAKLQNGCGGVLIEAARETKNKRKKKKLFQQAFTHLDKAISLYPTYSNAWLLKGNAYLYQEEYDKAIETYSYLLSLFPENKNALNNLAIVYQYKGKALGEKKGDILGAIQYLEKSFNLNASDEQTRWLLGTAYGSSGNHQKALKFFLPYAQTHPEDKQTLQNIAHSYMQIGDTLNAYAFLEKIR